MFESTLKYVLAKQLVDVETIEERVLFSLAWEELQLEGSLTPLFREVITGKCPSFRAVLKKWITHGILEVDESPDEILFYVRSKYSLNEIIKEYEQNQSKQETSHE